MKLKWTELAVNDLERIRDYITKDSEFYAIRLMEPGDRKTKFIL